MAIDASTFTIEQCREAERLCDMLGGDTVMLAHDPLRPGVAVARVYIGSYRSVWRISSAGRSEPVWHTGAPAL